MFGETHQLGIAVTVVALVPIVVASTFALAGFVAAFDVAAIATTFDLAGLSLRPSGPPGATKSSSVGPQQENSEQSREKATNTISQVHEKVNGTIPSTPRAPKSDNQQSMGDSPATNTDRSNSTKLALYR